MTASYIIVILCFAFRTFRAQSAIIGGNATVGNCPDPFPPGIPRVSGTPPNYYPMADRSEIIQTMKLLECRRNRANIKRFLRQGCPRFWTVANNNTASLLSYVIYGLGSWYPKDCVATHPTRFESFCTHPGLDPRLDYKISQTLRTPAFTVAVRCYNDGVYSWIASSVLPILEADDLFTLKQHVTSLGFDWDKAERIHYDDCVGCVS